MICHFDLLARTQCSAALLLGLAFTGGALALTPTPSDAADRGVATVEVAQHNPAAGALATSATPLASSPVAQAPVTPRPERIRRIEIGSATQTLWDLQRASPGVRPRPIDGDQASRSYQRYLKSFETTIPEHYSTGIGVTKK